MNFMTLLVANQLASSKGIDDPHDRFRIAATASVFPSAVTGLVVANALADRDAPVTVGGGTQPTDPKAIVAELEKIRAEQQALQERQQKLEEALKALQAGASPGTGGSAPAPTPVQQKKSP